MTENPIGGNELEVRIAALEAKLAAHELTGLTSFATVGPRTDLTEGHGPRVRMGLIEAGRFMGEVLDAAGNAHGFPKLIGEPFLWATTTLPPLSKWCDGTALMEDDYPELFAVLGSTYDTYRGQSDPGAGMFRVPKYDGLVLVGFDSGDGDFNAVTDTGGSKNAIVVTHSHTVNSHTHGVGTYAISPDPHTHTIDTRHNALFDANSTNQLGEVQAGAGTESDMTTQGTALSLTGSSAGASPGTDSQGSSGTGANLQPYGVTRFAIFAGR